MRGAWVGTVLQGDNTLSPPACGAEEEKPISRSDLWGMVSGGVGMKSGRGLVDSGGWKALKVGIGRHARVIIPKVHSS